jgi:RNA polymerase-binding transcription factor DksA
VKAVRSPSKLAVPARWQWHYRTLLRLERMLRAETSAREAEVRLPRERAGSDAVDVATSEQERDEALSELQLENAELSEIEAALGRIAAGTYGQCSATGEPIEAERLRAIPWTRFCRRAATRQEATRASADGRKT